MYDVRSIGMHVHVHVTKDQVHDGDGVQIHTDLQEQAVGSHSRLCHGFATLNFSLRLAAISL